MYSNVHSAISESLDDMSFVNLQVSSMMTSKRDFHYSWKINNQLEYRIRNGQKDITSYHPKG